MSHLWINSVSVRDLGFLNIAAAAAAAAAAGAAHRYLEYCKQFSLLGPLNGFSL